MQAFFGLVIVSAPVFNGAHTTTYSLMNFLVRGGRDVLSLESPRQWPIEGARQVEVASTDEMQETLRGMVAVEPEALVLFSVPDAATAGLACQLATSVLVVGLVTAQRASQALVNLLQLGVPPLAPGQLALRRDLPAPGAPDLQGLPRARRPSARADPRPPRHRPRAGAGPAFFRGRGCPSCNKVGYRGRRAIFEVMTASPEVQRRHRRRARRGGAGGESPWARACTPCARPAWIW